MWNERRRIRRKRDKGGALAITLSGSEKHEFETERTEGNEMKRIGNGVVYNGARKNKPSRELCIVKIARKEKSETITRIMKHVTGAVNEMSRTEKGERQEGCSTRERKNGREKSG